MHRVLLLHTNREYAETLCEHVSKHVPDFDPVVVSRVPLSRRLQSVITGKFDVIQADELLVNGVIAATGTLIGNDKFVSTVRGWADYTNAHGQYGGLRNATIRARTRYALRRSAATIFLSGVTRDEFCRSYPVGDHAVIGRPIDLDRYAHGKRADRETFDILTVTNLRYEEKYHGVITILEGLGELFASTPRLRFRIAAGGRYLAQLRSFLSEYEYSNQVELLGYVDCIEDEFASADVFVYVSFLDAYPTVVLEAQAAGLPVVGGNAVGVPDVVGDGGLLCEPSTAGVRDALQSVVFESGRRSRLREKSLERMSTYNEECARGHAEVWREVLSQ